MNQCNMNPIALKPSSSGPALKTVGIWIRVSSEDQAQGESPAHHLERAKAYAQARGWTVNEVYDLAGVSGKSVKEHPEAKRMLADVKRGHITGLIFSKLARLARNTKELLEFSDYFRDHNADLISISKTIDTSTPAGRLFFTIIAAMATWEREEIADRQKASILIRARLGKSINGQAPYGYQWKDRQLVPHPDEAPIRAKAFQLFRQYRRKGRVTTLLNAAGHRTRGKALWGHRQLGRLLTCPSAKGVYYFNRIHKHGAWKGTPKPESEWGKAECQPIVSSSLWEQVNRILQGQLDSCPRRGKLPTHPFGNLVWCGCGKKMYVRADSPKVLCRACNRKIPSPDLDAMIRKELFGFFGGPERVAHHLDAARQNLAAKEAAMAAHEREIATVREEMNRTHRLYQDGQISAQGFGQFYKPAEEHLNRLLADLHELRSELAHLQGNEVSAQAVVTEAQTLHHRWPNLTRDQKRQVTEALVEKLVIGDDQITLTLSALPTSEELCKTQQQTAPVILLCHCVSIFPYIPLLLTQSSRCGLLSLFHRRATSSLSSIHLDCLAHSTWPSQKTMFAPPL